MLFSIFKYLEIKIKDEMCTNKQQYGSVARLGKHSHEMDFPLWETEITKFVLGLEQKSCAFLFLALREKNAK